MRVHKTGLSFLLSAALLALVPVTVLAQTQPQAQTQGAGVIQGQVINKTPNGKSVADIYVDLNPSSISSHQGSAKINTRTDAQGNFQFTGLSTDASASYQVSFTYQEADYTSETVTFATGETSKTVQITVWDSTDTDPGIKISASHVVVQFSGDQMEITEYYKMENPGDRAYIGSKPVPKLDKKETLRFFLPSGAQVHQYALDLMECCVSVEGNALIDTMAILPGSREIAFIYGQKFSAPNYTLPIVASLPTDQLSLVVEDKGIQVSSPQLSLPRRTKMEDLPVLVLSTSNLKRGDTVTATLSGLPSTGSNNSVRILGIGLIVIALGFGVTYPLVRKRKAMPIRVTPEEERSRLLEEVARMDNSFAAGLIAEDEYYKLRAIKMARLMALSRSRSG